MAGIDRTASSGIIHRGSRNPTEIAVFGPETHKRGVAQSGSAPALGAGSTPPQKPYKQSISQPREKGCSTPSSTCAGKEGVIEQIVRACEGLDDDGRLAVLALAERLARGPEASEGT